MTANVQSSLLGLERIARAFQGVGGALLVPGSLAIISASFDSKQRGRAIGAWSGFTAITSAVVPLIGGLLVQFASWRWVFFINAPLAAMVLIVVLALFSNSLATHLSLLHVSTGIQHAIIFATEQTG